MPHSFTSLNSPFDFLLLTFDLFRPLKLPY